MEPRRVAILGSTGSIGRQALEVIRSLPALAVCGLAAGGNWELLGQQASEFKAPLVALADEQAAGQLAQTLPAGTRLLTGKDAMTDLVCQSRPDVLLTGVVGSAGLAPTLAAIDCGSTLAIANKETLVMAGAVVMPRARQAGVAVLPVDSEHSAIFQCLAAGKRGEVRRVTITSSGGALRDWDEDRLARATVDDALKHPTWRMGRKITIDSATLINKALEMIEAHWLFDLRSDQIEVVLHTESIMHAAVEFQDGSVVAQLARPDMTMPIAYALCYAQRPLRDAPRVDLAALGKLSFAPLPSRCRRAVELGRRVIDQGGCSGAVLNAANEQAVQAFLDARIPFGQIVPLVEDILNQCPPMADITLRALVDADAWARQEVTRRLGTTASAKQA